ncbi:MAG: YraN family protein [bacterium]|nr:YraN family protein [bacterium]
MAEKTEKQKIGRLGEDIAQKYLENKGFSIIEQNFLRKCGEIDIIAKKGKILHFIEVKSVTRENIPTSHRSDLCISSRTDKYRAEDNLHPYKLKRLRRTTQVYLYERRPEDQIEWVFDAITVQIDVKNRTAKVKFLENFVL